ncbi:7637_t:CDS:2 [Entrophospora sp. SA101]|nr:7637_t:CDS:2 [Entrophospora sp. SA101]
MNNRSDTIVSIGEDLEKDYEIFNDLSADIRNPLLVVSIFLGLFHLNFEIRQYIWNPRKYLTDFWNYFAYTLPIITSIFLLIDVNSPPRQLISISNLLLDLKFMLFLRTFKYFGVPIEEFDINKPTTNDDDNNPWNLVNKYSAYFADNDSYSQYPYFIQQPDETTNMFARYNTSMLAMYNFLAGDNGAFGPWPLQDDPYLAFLFVVFSFVVVVYLMNLFIGLLSNAIEENNSQEVFLSQKAKIITEIELFYLLPNQRRWKNWFPEILTYNVPVEDVRKKIKEIDDSDEDAELLPFISDELRNYVDVHKPDNIHSKFEAIEKKIEQNETNLKNDLKKIEENLKNELIQNNNQLLMQMQTLMNEIKALKK